MKIFKKDGFINFLAFVCLVIVAVLEVFNFCAQINLFTIEGILLNILYTIKNVCLMLVIGISSFKFAKGKKGLIITFIIALVIIVASTVSLWF